jgi:two-component system OmpR family response regulator
MGFTLDMMERLLVSAEGSVHRLSGCEYQLLHALVSHSNRVLSRSQLAELMYGRELEPHDRSIDVLVSRLRQLLRDSARDPRIIRTVYGRGYVLTGNVTAD